MIQTHTAVGFHISEDPSGDHVFMDVRDFDRSGNMGNVKYLRFKGEYKNGRPGTLYTEENLRSKAAELSIFIPVSEEAGMILRSLAAFLVDLDSKNSLPFVFSSKPGEVDPLGRLRICGDQAEQPTRVKMNCFDIVILGCAMAGIDTACVFNMSRYEDNGMSASNNTRNLALMSVIQQEKELVVEHENYRVFSAKNGTPRLLALGSSLAHAGSPVQSFSAVVNARAGLDCLTGEFAAARDRFPLPLYLKHAAQRAGVPIPRALTSRRK